jgi:preprotein translocase subunit SecB
LSQVSRVDVETYRDFLKCIEIENVYLKSLSVLRKNDPGPDGVLTITYGPDSHTLDEMLLNVLFSTRVKAESRVSSSDKRQTIATMKTLHVVKYKLKIENPDEALINFFVQNNVIVNVWPYVRELVQSLSYRLDIPPIVLGVRVASLAPETDEGSR